MTTPMFFGEFLKRFGARSGNRFGELEIFVVFVLAKILRAKQFLGADDLRARFAALFGQRRVSSLEFAAGLRSNVV